MVKYLSVGLAENLTAQDGSGGSSDAVHFPTLPSSACQRPRAIEGFYYYLQTQPALQGLDSLRGRALIDSYS